MPRNAMSQAKLDRGDATGQRPHPLLLHGSAPAPDPDGILALLVTDLENFTGLVERLGDRHAQAIIRAHNQLLRRCIHVHRGHEVAHMGDGILAVFRSASAALCCASDVQRALFESEPLAEQPQLRVRMGVHAGEPLPEEDRLFGHCVNMVVRVCAAAIAGQVLVTDVVKQLTQGRFVFDAGASHQLRGFAAPAVLYDFAWKRDAHDPCAS